MNTNTINPIWVPAAGELFYIKNLRVSQKAIRNEVGDVVTVVKQMDKSYSDNIFRMVAVDGNAFVADIVYGYMFTNERRMLLRSEFAAVPVGPDVALALGLQISTQSEESF